MSFSLLRASLLSFVCSFPLDADDADDDDDDDDDQVARLDPLDFFIVHVF